MSRTSAKARWVSFGIAFLILAGTISSAMPGVWAQDSAKPKKDDALEDLLKDLKAGQTPAPPKADAKTDSSTTKGAPAGKPADPAPRRGAPATEGPEATKTAAKPKPSSAAPPKDRDLDNLLEKLGETRDAPTPEERRPPQGGQPGDDEKKPPKSEPAPGGGKPGQREKETLTGRNRDLDEHLEELGGRRKPKKGEDDGEGSGPLSDVIKEMRNVEERLGKTDTGEETRKKQQQIVKNLETLIEQMRAESGKPSGQQKKQLAMKGGKQPGGKPGETPGSNPGGAPSTKPEKPTNKRALAGGKDEWGHLPPELRQEMENVFREEFLPAREELIRRYYDSVARKTLKRGE
ncbi:MAG: hypothetical protein U0794_13190 [Isosphaeraceae bacterium]